VCDDGWHRKHAVRALCLHEAVDPDGIKLATERKSRYGATIEDAVTALR